MTESESASDAEVEARLRAVVANTTQNLSDDDLTTLRQKISQSLKQRQAMRAVTLHNHDEPEHGFDPAASSIARDEADR